MKLYFHRKKRICTISFLEPAAAAAKVDVMQPAKVGHQATTTTAAARRRR